jgi:hypothetical protein
MYIEHFDMEKVEIQEIPCMLTLLFEENENSFSKN